MPLTKYFLCAKQAQRKLNGNSDFALLPLKLIASLGGHGLFATLSFKKK